MTESAQITAASGGRQSRENEWVLAHRTLQLSLRAESGLDKVDAAAAARRSIEVIRVPSSSVQPVAAQPPAGSVMSCTLHPIQ